MISDDLTDALKDLLVTSLQIFRCGLYIYFWFTEL